MSVIKTPCPDCGGKIHCENYLDEANSRSTNKKSYARYECIGDSDMPYGYDGSKLISNGCGFLAVRRSDPDNNTDSKRINSEELDNWNQWEKHDNQYTE